MAGRTGQRTWARVGRLACFVVALGLAAPSVPTSGSAEAVQPAERERERDGPWWKRIGRKKRRPPESAPKPQSSPSEQLAEEPVAESPASEPLDEPSPGDVLERALAAWSASDKAWARGQPTQAVALIDDAYALMLQLREEGDPSVIQQKDDLRRLIAERLVEIYTPEAAPQPIPSEIPRQLNARVEREIRSFRTRERAFFLDAHRRSGRYRAEILAALDEAGLPPELSWLPLVESGFDVRALSPARALGLWQFIPSTGLRFGLRRDEWIDERIDPRRSTEAAVAYLTELHDQLGDWLTVLAAYNSGPGTVARAIRRQRAVHHDQFWDLYRQLPEETARYVPRFLATLAIVEDPLRHGFDLPPVDEPAGLAAVEVARAVELGDLDRAVGLPEGALSELNPELRHGATPGEPYELLVPWEHAEDVRAALHRVPAWSLPGSHVGYRVRTGETLSSIATAHGTSIRALMQLNDLRNPNRIWPGQMLKVPAR